MLHEQDDALKRDNCGRLHATCLQDLSKRQVFDSTLLDLTNYLHVSLAAEVADNSQRLEDSAKGNRLQDSYAIYQPSIFISPSNVCRAAINGVSSLPA